MEKLKLVWEKAAKVFDYIASWVAEYPKIALGVMIVLAMKAFL